MVNTALHQRVVAFDLDDTLYDECEYVLSGKRAIASLLEKVCGIDIRHHLENEHCDFIELACHLCHLPSDVKPSLLWHYRLHSPSITCRPGAYELLKRLEQEGVPVCVITDGRYVTQSLKIQALGIKVDKLLISEAVGAEKPSRRSFEIVQAAFPAEKYYYIGDNPKKDFIAPNQLGWHTIGISPRLSNIHKSTLDKQDERVDPHVWIDSLSDLANHLFTDR